MGITTGYQSLIGPRFFLETDGELATDLIPMVYYFEYNDHESKIDHMIIRVANPGLKFKDDKRFQSGAKFRMRFGYTSDISDVKNAIIAKAKPNYPQSGIPTIEMEAYGLQIGLNKYRNPTNYGPVSSSDCAKVIAARYSFLTDIEESKDQRRQERIQPADTTDTQFLMSLAHRLNWDFYIEGLTLHFHHKRFEKPSNLEFIYFTDKTGTLLSFSPNVDLTKPPGVTNTGASTRTGDTTNAGKPQISVRIEKKNLGLLGGGFVENRPNSPKVSFGKGGLAVISAESDPRVLGITGSAVAQRIDMSAVKATAEMVGSPRIKARTVITISGVDRQYSGNWRVVSSRHIIEPKGVYKTHVELKKDIGAANNTNNKKTTDPNSGKPQIAVRAKKGDKRIGSLGGGFLTPK